MASSRRTLIAMLGLAPAGAAVGAEQLINPPEVPGELQAVAGGYSNERFAEAFERMAAALRSGAISVERVRFSSDLQANALADRHEMVMDFIYTPEIG